MSASEGVHNSQILYSFLDGLQKLVHVSMISCYHYDDIVLSIGNRYCCYLLLELAQHDNQRQCLLATIHWFNNTRS